MHITLLVKPSRGKISKIDTLVREDRLRFRLLNFWLIHFSVGAALVKMAINFDLEDVLVKERINKAAEILNNKAALIFYAASRGEDLTTARIGLLRMLSVGWTETFLPTSPRVSSRMISDDDDYSSTSSY